MATSQQFRRNYQQWMDRTIPYSYPRWILFSFLCLVYFVRAIYPEKYFAVTYLLLFHVLKTSIQFMTPKGVPSIDDEDEVDVLVDEIPTFQQ